MTPELRPSPANLEIVTDSMLGSTLKNETPSSLNDAQDTELSNKLQILAPFDTCETSNLDPQDIEKFGTISNEQAVQALDLLADVILTEHPDVKTDGKLTFELLQKIADVINTHFSFQFSGPGRATIPKQLIAVTQTITNNQQSLPSKGELADQCDCKLLTTLLAMVLKKLGFDQDGKGLIFVRNSTSTHPSLLVKVSVSENEEKLYKVDYLTKFRVGIPDDIILNRSTRHLTESYASVNPVSKAVVTGINKSGLLYHLNADDLARLDYHFLRM